MNSVFIEGGILDIKQLSKQEIFPQKILLSSELSIDVLLKEANAVLN